MIIDKLENAHLYANISGKIAKALEILKAGEMAKNQDGQYEVEGEDMYCIVVHYPAKPIEQCKFEAHEKYIDVQFIVAGREMVGWADTRELTIKTPYNDEKDAALYEAPANYSKFEFSQNQFCILWPDDAHMPACQLDGPSDIHKVVVKVKVDAE